MDPDPSSESVSIGFPPGDGGAEGRFALVIPATTDEVALYCDGAQRDATEYSITAAREHSHMYLCFWCSAQTDFSEFTLNGETVIRGLRALNLNMPIERGGRRPSQIESEQVKRKEVLLRGNG